MSWLLSYLFPSTTMVLLTSLSPEHMFALELRQEFYKGGKDIKKTCHLLLSVVVLTYIFSKNRLGL